MNCEYRGEKMGAASLISCPRKMCRIFAEKPLPGSRSSDSCSTASHGACRVRKFACADWKPGYELGIGTCRPGRLPRLQLRFFLSILKKVSAFSFAPVLLPSWT